MPTPCPVESQALIREGLCFAVIIVVEQCFCIRQLHHRLPICYVVRVSDDKHIIIFIVCVELANKTVGDFQNHACYLLYQAWLRTELYSASMNAVLPQMHACLAHHYGTGLSFLAFLLSLELCLLGIQLGCHPDFPGIPGRRQEVETWQLIRMSSSTSQGLEPSTVGGNSLLPFLELSLAKIELKRGK